MPNKAKLRKWVTALRSGDYAQGWGTNFFQDEWVTQYCCLGVACKIAEDYGVIDEVTNWRQSACLTEAVRNWLGVECLDPMLPFRGGSTETSAYASNLNDYYKRSFAEIADSITEKYNLDKEDSE